MALKKGEENVANAPLAPFKAKHCRDFARKKIERL
jgi:hypothetical protein